MTKILWEPDPNTDSHFHKFKDEINQSFDKEFSSFSDVYKWSINNPADFWGKTLKFTDVIYTGNYQHVLNNDIISPNVKWFEGSKLNFAENLLRFKNHKPAIISMVENGSPRVITYNQLYKEVVRLSTALKKIGIKKGDRVAGFLPNIPESIVAMLATTSLGAIWSSCSPDFGEKSVTDRFSQIEPKIIFSANAYDYNGKRFNCLKKLNNILKTLPSIEQVVIIDFLKIKIDISDVPNSIDYDMLIDIKADSIEFEHFPFDHPLYILYTSGTTGLPKSIVHGAGGTLLQHKKEMMLHCNIQPNDIVFYYTTCGWMMWNWLVSFLSSGAAIVLYEGSPFYPNPKAMWDMIDKLNITIFGTSAKFIDSCKKQPISPKNFADLKSLRMILSTGSPLVDESFDYVYNEVKNDVQLASISGGTDLISCFALSSPVLPVYRGELQCRGLGMDVDAFDANGYSVRNLKGELVCKTPFPSMPIYFWNDQDGDKYKNAYFNKFPDTWAHGDFIEINDHGGLKIFGRSDSTLNPGGVRIGTAEIYRVVEAFDEVSDSLVIGQDWNGDQRVVLFLKLSQDILKVDNNLTDKIKQSIHKNCSPRHVPSIIMQINDIPYTISGKKVEISVKKIIDGEDVTNRDALANPDSLDLYKDIPELT